MGLVALAALTFGLGAGGETSGGDDGEKVFLVYSADERSELFPCG
jgi:hypothetical protein